jgi:hypothetical protein
MQPEDVWMSPDKTSDVFYEMLDDHTRQQGWSDISLQFKNLINIGLDYSIDYPEVFDDEELMKELINYVHDNYLPVQDIHLVLGDEIKTKIIGKLLYRFIVLDFPRTLLPRVVKDNEVSLDDINKIHIRDSVITLLTNKINRLNEILSVRSDYREMKKNRFKNLFYLQLIDNDLEKFQNEYISPLIELNYSTIYSLIK